VNMVAICVAVSDEVMVRYLVFDFVSKMILPASTRELELTSKDSVGVLGHARLDLHPRAGCCQPTLHPTLYTRGRDGPVPDARFRQMFDNTVIIVL